MNDKRLTFLPCTFVKMNTTIAVYCKLSTQASARTVENLSRWFSCSKGASSFMIYMNGAVMSALLFGARSLASLTSRSHSHLDIFCWNILFYMQEFLNLLFLFSEKVLLPGLELQTLDWRHYFFTYPLDQPVNDVGKCNFLVIIF